MEEGLEVGFEVLGRWEGDEEHAEELPAFEDALAGSSPRVSTRLKAVNPER